MLVGVSDFKREPNLPHVHLWPLPSALPLFPKGLTVATPTPWIRPRTAPPCSRRPLAVVSTGKPYRCQRPCLRRGAWQPLGRLPVTLLLLLTTVLVVWWILKATPKAVLAAMLMEGQPRQLQRRRRRQQRRRRPQRRRLLGTLGAGAGAKCPWRCALSRAPRAGQARASRGRRDCGG
jgi:hypothetical protein